ncbi:MAG: response regulator [Deltaproteobacteria bacterium]|nr:response regulator [Deltaproteobacteria bacterium]MBN2670610.1 response regulator [Deltaproteobacteria bacterium]
MTIFALISLLSFVASLFLGSFIYFKDTKATINRLYFVICMSVAYFSFLDFGYKQAKDLSEAMIWWRFDFLWSLHTAIWLHLAILFTEREKWLKQKFVYVLIYAPVAIFIFLDGTGHYITGPPIKQPWGWSYSVRDNILSSISYVWMSALPIISAGLYIWYLGKPTDIRKAAQSRFMLAAGITTLLSVFVELTLQLLEVSTPSLTVLAFILANVFVGYAIWKYELFTLTPSKAAESIIATMGDSLMLVGLDGAIISANQATTRMLGFSERELIGKLVKYVFAPNAHIPVWIRETNRKKEDTFRSKDIETEYITHDGKIIPVSLSGSMLNDEEGNLRGFLLIARDITERKRAESEIEKHREHLEELVEERTSQLSKTNVQLQQEINERQKAELEKKGLQEQLYQAQKMEAIGRLAGGVAHDFNNLLFVINGYAESLLDDFKDNPQVIDDLSQIAEAGKRAVNLTRQLLAFSRKQIIDPVLVNVNERIESSYKMLSRLIGEDIRIYFSNSAKSGKVVMDITQLDQVVANLVVNARDAMPLGGEIKIHTENLLVSEKDCENHPERSAGNFVCISISDTGCGIPEDKLKMIFEPFYTSKEVGKGTGLGLATVYGIVKQNDGFIEVDSQLDVGSTFKIFLPRAGRSGATSDTNWEDTAPQRGFETVLLVEDEHLVRRLAKRQLESNGYSVIEAVDGNAAIEIFRQHEEEIDIVLTDVVMPGISGVELVKKLKQKSPLIKVIFMSGHNDEIIDQHGIRKTQYPLLTKPFTVQQLCEKLREVLDGLSSKIPPPPSVTPG